MSRRRELAVYGFMAAVGVVLACIDYGPSHAGRHHPAPRPTATASSWQQQFADAQVELEANGTALRAAHVDGQPVDRLTRQYCASVQNRDAAAVHLHLAELGPIKECPKR